MTEKATGKKLWRVRLWKIGVLAFVLALIVVGLEYFRFQGLKQSLIELVAEKTNGDYRLVIEESDIDYLDLSVTFTDAYIESTNQTLEQEIEKVELPEAHIDFGSLFSLLNRKQIIIQEFFITEPVVIINSRPKKQALLKDARPLNLAHEITRLYPLVEEVLNQFDIESFAIRRADLNITRVTDGARVEIGLISLLIENWNMLNLSDEASLQFILEQQEVNIDRSRINFEKIIYDYQDNLLRLENVDLVQYDTLNRLAFEVSNADLIIDQLDYDELLDAESYILEEIKIDSAQITAYLYGGNVNVTRPEEGIKYPISRLLKDNLGELHVREGGLFNASLSLSVRKETDTVELNLPEISLGFKDFMVTKDSSTVMFDDLTLEAKEAVFSLDEDFQLKFSHLFYDDGKDLEVDSVELKHASADYDVIACEKITLYNFSIFDYLFDRDLRADSLKLVNGGIVFTQPPSEIRPMGRTRINTTERQPMSIHLNKIIYSDINLTYDHGGQVVTISRIDGVMSDYIKEDSTTYQLEYFKSDSVKYSDRTRQMEADVLDFYFEPEQLRLGRLTGTLRGMNFNLQRVRASPQNYNIAKPFYYSWNELSVSSISLNGKIPASSGKKTKVKPPNLRVNSTRINRISVDLSGKGKGYKLNGRNINIQRAGYIDGQVRLPGARGTFDHIELTDGDLDFRISNVSVDNSRKTSISELTLANSAVSATLNGIEVGPWTYQSKELKFDHAAFSELRLTQLSSGLESSIDSLGIDQFSWTSGKDPSLDQINIYNPVIRWRSEKNNSTTDSSIPDSLVSERPTPFKWVRELTVYSGNLSIDDKHVTVGLIDLQRRPAHLQVRLDNIEYGTENYSLALGKIYTTDKDIKLENFRVNPKNTYVRTNAIETDIFTGKVNSVDLKEIYWDSLFNHNVLHSDEVLINGFDFTIRRDKRLPDPPAEKKPFLFSQLVPQIPGVYIPSVVVSGGNITYVETSEKTGRRGTVRINDIEGTLNRRKPLHRTEDVLTATARLYDTATFSVDYNRLDEKRFSLQLQLANLPAPMLNQVVDSLEAVRLKSGYIHEFDLSAIGTDEKADVQARITYTDLHIEIFKRASPDVKNFGSGLLTLLADGIILRHSKYGAIGQLEQVRIQEKGPINYWVKSATFGALTAVRKGKSQKRKKNKKRKKGD